MTWVTYAIFCSNYLASHMHISFISSRTFFLIAFCRWSCEKSENLYIVVRSVSKRVNIWILTNVVLDFGIIHPYRLRPPLNYFSVLDKWWISESFKRSYFIHTDFGVSLILNYSDEYMVFFSSYGFFFL